MKKTVLALGIAGTLTLSGLSQAGTLSSTDKDFLFGSKSVQVKTVSIEEMKNTDGEYWPLVYWGAVGIVRFTIWAAPRIAPRYFRYINSWNRNQHRILLGGRNNRHLLQIGIDRRGHHIGIGWNAKNNARWHIYRNRPWRINPY